MQRIKIIFFLLFISPAFYAQVNYSWYPVHPNTQYNYKADTSALPFSVVIRADSISSSGVLHLNKIVTRCDTCLNSLLVNDPFDSTYVLVHQPQFLGHSVLKLPGNAFYFKGPRAFTLRPFNAIGSPWIFDSLQNTSAVILYKSAQAVLGLPDSLCFIKLSTSDTIILSKNYGIVQFPFKTISAHRYYLAGLEGPINAGIRLKRFHDFFDFSAGNVLQYAFEEDDYNNLPPTFMRGHERWDFLSAAIFPDSVRCTIRQTHLDSVQLGNNPAVTTAYTQTVNLTFIDSSRHPANLYPLQEIMTNPYFIFNNGTRSIHKIIMGINAQGKITKSFGQTCPGIFLEAGMTGAASETPFANVFLNRNSLHIVGRELTEDLGFTSELFNNYDRISQHCLIGYIKGADTSGTIYSDVAVGLRSNKAFNPYTLYPVPANELINIKGLLPAGTRITIMSAVGEQVYSSQVTCPQLTQQINTSALANGLYFIVISGTQFNDVKKLVIRH